MILSLQGDVYICVLKIIEAACIKKSLLLTFFAASWLAQICGRPGDRKMVVDRDIIWAQGKPREEKSNTASIRRDRCLIGKSSAPDI